MYDAAAIVVDLPSRRRVPLGEHRDGVWLPIGEVDEPGIVRDGGDVPGLVRDPGASRQPRRDATPELLRDGERRASCARARELNARSSPMRRRSPTSPSRRDAVVDPVLERGLVLDSAPKVDPLEPVLLERSLHDLESDEVEQQVRREVAARRDHVRRRARETRSVRPISRCTSHWHRDRRRTRKGVPSNALMKRLRTCTRDCGSRSPRWIAP